MGGWGQGEDGSDPVKPLTGYDPVKPLTGYGPVKPLTWYDPVKPLTGYDPVKPLTGYDPVKPSITRHVTRHVMGWDIQHIPAYSSLGRFRACGTSTGFRA